MSVPHSASRTESGTDLAEGIDLRAIPLDQDEGRSFSSEIVQTLAIVLLCIVAAVVYGVLHDQVTARVCVEYFTVGHVPLFDTDNPTLLALGWGVRAAWWAGVLIGIPLAAAARGGRAPKRTAASLVRPILKLMLCMAALALVAGVAGWLLGGAGIVALTGPIADRLPPDRHVPYLADLWAHSASYLAGFAGGVLLIVQVLNDRLRREVDAAVVRQ